jgi:hypothetical protein
MIGMPVGDECAFHRTHGVDVEITGRAIKAFGRGAEKLVETHGFKIGHEVRAEKRGSLHLLTK